VVWSSQFDAVLMLSKRIEALYCPVTYMILYGIVLVVNGCVIDYCIARLVVVIALSIMWNNHLRKKKVRLALWCDTHDVFAWWCLTCFVTSVFYYGGIWDRFHLIVCSLFLSCRTGDKSSYVIRDPYSSELWSEITPPTWS
jgi:hypothetical protein